MQQHVKILGILHIVFGAIGVLLGIGGLLFFGGIAGIVGLNETDPDKLMAIPILGIIGGVVLVTLLLISLPGIIAGYGLINFRPWARILTIVLSALNLLNVPFGTMLGIYGLWVLLSTEGEALFRPRAVPRQW